MTQDTRGYVNLDYVVNLCLMDNEDYQTQDYKRLFQYAVTGFTKLNLFAISNIKVAYLPISSINTVDLPDDYIDYVKVGIESCGQVYTLTRRENMMIPRGTDDCGNPTGVDDVCDLSSANDNSSLGPHGYYFASHYRNGQYVGEMYGVAGGNNIGYYRVDLERRQIVFSGGLPSSVSEIILEYQSSGIKSDGSTIVPRQAVEALRTWIHWNASRYKKNVGLSDKARLKQEWIEEFEMLRFFETCPTLDEYLDHTRSNRKNTPRN